MRKAVENFAAIGYDVAKVFDLLQDLGNYRVPFALTFVGEHEKHNFPGIMEMRVIPGRVRLQLSQP